MNDSTRRFSKGEHLVDTTSRWMSHASQYRGAVGYPVWFASALGMILALGLCFHRTSASPSGSFHANGTISYDECQNGTIVVPGEEDNYTFSGGAGDSVVVFLDNTGPGFLSLRLSRGGTTLDYETFLTGGDKQVGATLPANDTYTVTVDGYGDDTPGYTLCLNLIDVDGAISSYDQCLSGAISLMGSEDNYTFSGGAGDSVVVFLDNTGPGFLSLRLSRGGTTLDYETFLTGGDRQVGATLPANDTYTVTVDGYGDDTPGYTLCLNLIDVDTWIISYGQCLSDSISVMGSEDNYTFNGWAGQQVTVFLDNTGPGFLSLRLSRGGTTLDYETFLTGGDKQVGATLPANDTYTVTVDGYGDDTPGYTLCLPNPTGIGTSQIVELGLYQNHPNPFNPSTTISFTLPERVRVTLLIYDVGGRLVRTLVDELVGEGYQERIWDGKDASGSEVGSGVYFYRLTAGDETQTKKMVVLK